MATSADHIEQLKRAYRIWHESRGANAQPWLDLMADDVKMQSVSAGAPEMAFTKARQGKAEAEKYFAGLLDDWEMVHFTPEEFIAQDDRVVMLGRVAFRFRKTGKVAESLKVDVFRFREGLIFEFSEFFDTACAFAATRPEA